MFNANKQSGFTLVEIVVVIAIMGIIGGLSSLIIGRSLDSYAALERREKLQTSVRLAVERISRELRHALPHSICVHDGTNCVSSAQNRFYFIPAKAMGRYQDRPGTYTAPPPIQRDRLPISPLFRDRFDVLSSNATNRLNMDPNDWVAVYNINNSDIYLGINNIRQQINTITLKDIHNDANANTDIEQIQFAANQTFPNHSPSRRFYIIDNNQQVTLFYLSGRNLFRETTTFAAPNTASTNSRLLIENVAACTFTYSPGSQQRAGLLRINITVEKNQEQIQVIHDAHVYNTP